MTRLTLSLQVALWATCALFPLSDTVGTAIGANSPTIVKEAITRYLCHEVYWEGQGYRTGVPLSLDVRTDSARFYAWVHDITNEPRNRISVFLMGSIGEGQTAVALLTGYNEDLGARIPGYTRDRRYFTETPVIGDTLTIPTDCTPRFDPPTPRKDRMLGTVLTTLERFLRSLARAGIWKGPHEATLTIADFNVDYPVTYVLVEPPGELYIVRLHNPQNYESDEYERNGEYPIGEILGEAQLNDLLPKVRKHGVIRKLVITP